MRARPRTIALVMTAMALPSFPVSFSTTEIKPIRQAKVLRKRDSSSTRDQLMRLSCSHLGLFYDPHTYGPHTEMASRTICHALYGILINFTHGWLRYGTLHCHFLKPARSKCESKAKAV